MFERLISAYHHFICLRSGEFNLADFQLVRQLSKSITSISPKLIDS
jgi:hypothetical protein